MSADIPSHYARSAGPRPPCVALDGDTRCDVAVVGAGITGLSAALHLAARGYEVVVLEGAELGAGASGRSGGQVLAGYACGVATLRAQLADADVKRLWDMSREAVQLTRDLIARHAIACDWREGHVDTAVKPRQQRELAEMAATLARVCGDTRLELLDGAALAREVRSARYCAGLFDPDSGHLHPLNYTLGLAHAALASGARVYEHSAVTAIDSGRELLLRCARGTVRARYAVLAQNTGRPVLDAGLRAKIMPVGTYIAATAPLGVERARALLPNNASVCDINFVLDYFRLSADHRLLFGGRVSYSGLTPPNLAASMRARMLRVFPELADVAIDSVWGGEVDITMNRAPHFGTRDGRILFAQGFSGHGMALTALAGKLMAEAIAGQAERFDLFSRLRHRDFPGGPWLRMPMLVLAMAYYRLRDLL
ncbi:MAG: FAD-binding oxidoreductase [Proteobacteria bacterium]|nr:FAD-binding oxidoreductase [Pseudomonadota bacterium]